MARGSTAFEVSWLVTDLVTVDGNIGAWDVRSGLIPGDLGARSSELSCQNVRSSPSWSGLSPRRLVEIQNRQRA